ncbi:NACHT, LRR and PYD domains-containing protein 1 [Hondaea fermentalgiana]|uniref:NACHT, LRR and PYD domains-containing protein 1 n=1 Tax=Hondaea fermentalgiana TaxID=2315210 RepID=A0A2R5GKP5_9STRA|nr:NACHT, LRR and PYD domains-containing protein 1 [Hondaea fermentalgiana]|eukprot:GBG31450.1 NACHT, LRR and PYD domains-containing protein 1 [Hondaea fermentalgiana]
MLSGGRSPATATPPSAARARKEGYRVGWDVHESKSEHVEENFLQNEGAEETVALVPCNDEEGSDSVYFREDAGTLSLGDKLLGDSGCIRLMQEIANSATLVRLDLRGNHIATDGAEAIANALRTNRTLRFLSLEWNRIGACDGGVRSLASSLEINQTLQDLDLRNNQIGPDGGLSLGRALRQNCGLRRLDLRWNELGTSGGRALANAVSEGNHTVREVLVTGNGVIGVHAQALRDAVARNAHPRVQEAVDDEKLENFARKLRLSSETSLTCQTAEDLVLVTREAAAKLRKDEAVEDHHVFADRVVELEVQVKRLQDALEAARADLVSERDARNEALQQVKTAHDQAAAASDAKERSHNALLKERSDCKMAQDEASKAKTKVTELESEQAALRARVEELEAAHDSQVRATEREAQQRSSIEMALSSVREERGELLRKLDEERALASRAREDAFTKQLEFEEGSIRQRDASAAEVRKLERQLDEARIAHSAEVDKLRREKEALEEKVARATREGIESAARQVSETQVAHAEEMVRVQSAADAARQDAVVALRKQQAEEIARLETEHEARTAREVAVACEQAVEKALAETVRVEVAKASKELSAVHKRNLWECEKRVREEAKIQAETLSDRHEQEVYRLEAEVARAKDQVRDLEQSHREELAKLQERARRALGDVFRLAPS